MTTARRLRVAMVHGPGPAEQDGVGDYVARLSALLPQVDVEVVRVPVRPSAEGRWLAATLAAAAEVRRRRPDLAHVQFAPSAYRFSAALGLFPALLPTRLPLVTTLHEYGDGAARRRVPEHVRAAIDGNRIWDRETGRLVPASSALVVTNPHHARLLNRRTGRRAIEIPLAPNVSDHGGRQGARKAVCGRLGLAPDTFLLTFFGFVHPVKGLRYVLEALPTLRAARADLRLAVVGGFTSQALPEAEAQAFRVELERVAVQHGVADAVIFTGYVPPAQASEWLHASDAVVLPFTAGVTRKSGSLLAALAHGVPTAATMADVPDPLLRDGETVAVIRRRRDAGAITAALWPLLHDTTLRRRLAAGGRSLAAEFSWPRVVARHRRLYDLLCERRGR